MLLLKDSKPNAIPSFQIKCIFKNFEENISKSKNFLSKLITYNLENLSIKNIDKTIIKLIKIFLLKFFMIIKNVVDKKTHLFSNRLGT